MKKSLVIYPALAMGLTLAAHAQTSAPPTKVGIIQIQSAIFSTKEGQKALGELQGKYTPRKSDLDKKQQELQRLQEQLQKGSATLSDEAKNKLVHEIDQSRTRLNRDTQDAQEEFDQEQGKIMQTLGQKIMAVLDKYARDNGYTLILDVSSPQTPVMYAATGIDVTKEIIELYDKAPASATGAPAAHPLGTPAGAPSAIHPGTPGGAPAARPPAAAPAPAVPPAAKKK